MGLKISDICLTGEEKTLKKSPRKLVQSGDRTRARRRACYRLPHSVGHVSYIKIKACKFVCFIQRNIEIYAQ